VKVKQPFFVGVPEIVQLANDNPGGTLPVTLHVYCALTSVAVIVVCGYVVPTTQSGSVSGEIAQSGSEMQIVQVLEDWKPFASVTVTVTR